MTRAKEISQYGMTEGLKMKSSKNKLLNQQQKVNNLLKDKCIKQIYLHRDNEVVIVLDDDVRFFIDSDSKLELSIT